jgi:hypothetical protein
MKKPNYFLSPAGGVAGGAGVAAGVAGFFSTFFSQPTKPIDTQLRINAEAINRFIFYSLGEGMLTNPASPGVGRLSIGRPG